MKRLFTLGFISLAVLGLATHSASAWWPCFPLCGCNKHCGKCCTTITLRQYNAFTPICSGSLHCDGCCPLTFNPCCMGGMGGMYGGMYGGGMAGGNYGQPMCCDGGACGADYCDGCDAGAAPAAPAASLPKAQPQGTYEAPPPAGQSMAPAYAWPQVRQAAYNPAPYYNPAAYYYYNRPAYNPYAYHPYAGANPYTPYYWNTGR